VPPSTIILELKDGLHKHMSLWHTYGLEMIVNSQIPDDMTTVASFTRSLDEGLTMNVTVCERDLIAIVGFYYDSVFRKYYPLVNLLDATQARSVKSWTSWIHVNFNDNLFNDNLKMISTRRGDILTAHFPNSQATERHCGSHPVRVISVDSGAERHLCLETAGLPRSSICAISQDGSLVAGTSGNCVSIWSTDTCERILDIDVQIFVRDVEFTSDNCKLLFKSEQIWSRVLDLQQQRLEPLPRAPRVIVLRPLSSGNFVALSIRGQHAILNEGATRYVEVNASLDDLYQRIPAASPVTDTWVAHDVDEDRFDVWILRGCQLWKLWGTATGLLMSDDIVSFTGTGNKLVRICFRTGARAIFDAATGVTLQKYDDCALFGALCAVPVKKPDRMQMQDHDEIQVGQTQMQDCDEIAQRPANIGDQVRVCAVEQPLSLDPIGSQSAAATRRNSSSSPRETSLVEALQQEQEDLMRACLVSKADVRSHDKIRVMRLTTHKPNTMEHLVSSDHLASVRSRVESAGCQVLPEWANGALLLVPLTPEQLAEADDFRPRPHHIVLLDQDVENVCEALRELPRTRKECRPKLKPEQNPDGAPGASRVSCGLSANLHEDVDLDGAGGLSGSSSSARRGGIHVDALDRRAEMTLSLRSHDLEFQPELLSHLRSLGLKLERTFLTTISSQGSDVPSAGAKSAPPGF